MKKWVVCTLCLVGATLSPGLGAQQSSAGSRQEVCTAIEAYVAAVNAARSLKEKQERQERYEQAKARLESVLRASEWASIISTALAYASYSEQIVTLDATDSHLPDLLEKRLKIQQTLLAPCIDSTTSSGIGAKD